MSDSLTADVSCLVGLTAADLTGPAPVPEVQPEWWYAAPDEKAMAGLNGSVVDGRTMMNVDVCEDVGRILSFVAEDNVRFTKGYGALQAPMLKDNGKGYINNRPENALPVLAADGTTKAISAGKGRFGHSPDTIEFMDALLDWHDRDEGVMFRFRLHDLGHTDSNGNKLLVAAGGVVGGLTWEQLRQLRHAEVSPEFMERDGSNQLEYVALSLVSLGNTNSSLDAPREPQRAALRRVATAELEEPAPQPETETVTEEAECTTCADAAAEAKIQAEEAAAAEKQGMADRVATLEQELAALVAFQMEQVQTK